jgi:hypothetical protein
LFPPHVVVVVGSVVVVMGGVVVVVGNVVVDVGNVVVVVVEEVVDGMVVGGSGLVVLGVVGGVVGTPVGALDEVGPRVVVVDWGPVVIVVVVEPGRIGSGLDRSGAGVATGPTPIGVVVVVGIPGRISPGCSCATVSTGWARSASAASTAPDSTLGGTAEPRETSQLPPTKTPVMSTAAVEMTTDPEMKRPTRTLSRHEKPVLAGPVLAGPVLASPDSARRLAMSRARSSGVGLCRRLGWGTGETYLLARPCRWKVKTELAPSQRPLNGRPTLRDSLQNPRSTLTTGLHPVGLKATLCSADKTQPVAL